MARTSEFDPVVVDAALSMERLAELLERGAESAKLDFKETYDPKDRAGKVRLAKHVLAMSNTSGGYIVFGVADDGSRVGLTPEAVLELDEAALREQMQAYSTVPLSLFLANRLVVEGTSFALLVVLPLPDRIAVAAADGQVGGGKGAVPPLFRAGEVLVRRGSSSRKWTQDDADWIMERIVRGKRDIWLREFASDFRRLMSLSSSGASGPSPIDETVLRMPPVEFADLIETLLGTPNE